METSPMHRSPDANEGGNENKKVTIEDILHSRKLVGHGMPLTEKNFDPKKTYNELLKGLEDKTIEQRPEVGDYTSNPENQNLNFKELIPEMISNPEWEGKPTYEVLRDVCEKYSETHYLPGIEYLQYLKENNIDCEDPKIFERHTTYYFPSTLIAKKGTYDYPVWTVLEGQLTHYEEKDPLYWDASVRDLYFHAVRAPEDQEIPDSFKNTRNYKEGEYNFKIILLKKEVKP